MDDEEVGLMPRGNSLYMQLIYLGSNGVVRLLSPRYVDVRSYFLRS